MILHWDKEQQSKAQNSDGKYRQMALAGFDTQTTELTGEGGPLSQTKTMQNIVRWP